MSATLGGSRSKSKSSTKPLFTGTDYSTRTGRKISFDPSIRALEESGINSAYTGQQNLSQAVGQFGTDLGALRQRLFTNQDPYMQARVAPLEERFAQERGGLARDIGRRGLSGSSFGQAAMTQQSAEQGRALGEQRALATQESIGAATTIDNMLLQARQAEAAGNLEQANYLRNLAAQRAELERSVMLTTGGFSRSVSTSINSSGSAGGGGGSPT